MALTYDQLTAITRKKFIPKLVDNIFDSNPLLKRAKEKGWQELIDGGEKIMVPLNYAKVSSAGWYEGSETLNTADNEIITAAEFTWKQLYVNVSIKRSDELKNSGDAQVVSLVKSKVQIAEKTMSDYLGTGLYSDGTDTKSIVGLRDITDVDQSVGGISQTDYSWWRGQQDTSTTTLTIPALRTQMTAATIDNDRPSVITATRSNFDRYHGLLQPQERFQDKDTANGGFANLMFAGVPFIADSYCPSAHIFGLNEKYLHLFVHKQENFRFEDFVKPVNQNVKVGKLYWMGALASSNNRMHFSFTGITG